MPRTPRATYGRARSSTSGPTASLRAASVTIPRQSPNTPPGYDRRPTGDPGRGRNTVGAKIPFMTDPRAGQPAQPSDLVDVPALVTAYYALDPDPADPAQQVVFGTSGHRGSSFDA